MAQGHHGTDPVIYPLPAVVGNADAKDAIRCGLCSSHIHTILISGPAGTGKTIMARAAAGISGSRRVIELPLNVTREQVFGTIDIETALSTGNTEVSDSLLRRANGNILVADNVNLLPKDLIHTVLDAVCEGIVRAELDGASVCEELDTLLIATMDPAEAELEPSELDRFDIAVDADLLDDQEDRMEVLRRSLAYSADAEGFSACYDAEVYRMSESLARADPDSVSLDSGLMEIISRVCNELGVAGHRGCISTAETACALAALDGRYEAMEGDIKRAVRLCLMHRSNVEEETDEEDEEQFVQEAEKASTEESIMTDSGTSGTLHSEPTPRILGHSVEGGDENEYDQSQDVVFAVGKTFRVKDFIPKEKHMGKDRETGRRGLTLSEDTRGRCIGYMIPRGKPRDVALGATIRVAAPHQPERERNGLAIAIHKEDVRDKVRVRRKGSKILFVVDGSGSMDSQSRMVAVKGTILSILKDAYLRRDMVGLVVFRGDGAEEVLPLTRSVVTAYRVLEEMPTGGRTPLNAGLCKGYEALNRYAERGEEPVMIVMTDGWGNVPVDSEQRPQNELRSIARVLSETDIRMVVVDTETKKSRFAKAEELSTMLGADFIKLDDINADSLSASVETALDQDRA